jgi:hypothetical protein
MIRSAMPFTVSAKSVATIASAMRFNVLPGVSP